MLKYIISFSIYTYFFINLGNTCFRRDSDNIVRFSIVPLLTCGFYGPVISIYKLFITGNFIPMINYILHESVNLANPYTAYYLTNLIINVIKFNFY